MKHLIVILAITMLVGCVPYQQQVYTQQVRTLNEIRASAKQGETIANKVLYQNQVDFENYNLDCGREITLQRILPKDDRLGKFDIIITDNTLLLPVVAYSCSMTHAKKFLVWDGKLRIVDANHANVDLIFIQSESGCTHRSGSSLRSQSRIAYLNADGTPVTQRNIQYPTVRYISFDLIKLRDAYSNSVTLNLLGLDIPLEYSY